MLIDYGPNYAELTQLITDLHEAQRLIRKDYVPEHLQRVLDDPNGKVIIVFSGGKDSVATYIHLRYRLGVPNDRIELWHHEIDGGGTPRFDWPCTPSYCQAFADAFQVPLLFSYREGGIAREMERQNEGLQDVLFQDEPGGKFIRLKSNPGNSTRMKWPAVSASLSERWCSAVAKIDVASRSISNSKRFKAGNFFLCSGERREESRNRATYAPLEPYRAMSRERIIYQWRPVLEWNESEVWAEYARHHIQPHPCYELGYSRCSCFTCIFLGPDGWASTAELAPERIDWVAEEEKKLSFTLYDKMDIRQKVAAGTSFIHADAKQRWKAEAMSTFRSPIILDSFTMPAGAFGKESAGSV